MITRGIREFAGRDWNSARRSKEAYWGERIARLGPAEAFRIADQLRREVLLLNPAWPDSVQREADVQCHVRVAELLQRAGPARSR
jgi:hypothetical protein